MKLTDSDVRLIRELSKDYTLGLYKFLAREFGVSAFHLMQIVKGARR